MYINEKVLDKPHNIGKPIIMLCSFIVQCNVHIFIRPGLHRQKPAIAAFQPPSVNRGVARNQPSGCCKQWTASYVHFIENKPLQNHYRSHAIALLKLCPFKTRNGKYSFTEGGGSLCLRGALAITSWQPAFKERESLQSCDSCCWSLQQKLSLIRGETLVVKVLREEEIGRKVLILLTGKVCLHKEIHFHTFLHIFFNT